MVTLLGSSSAGYVFSPAVSPLHADDLADLRRSGLTDETIGRMGVVSLDDPGELARAVLAPYPGWLGRGGGYVIPYRGPGGDELTVRVRRRIPRMDPSRPDRQVRYESRRGEGPDLRSPYVLDWALVTDISMPLIITEGEKKAASLCQLGLAAVGLPGVHAYVEARGSGRLHPAFGSSDIPIKGREIVIAFDNDAKATTRRDVGRAADELSKRLRAAGASDVRIATMPAPSDGSKCGVDDLYVVEGERAVREVLFPTAGTQVQTGAPTGWRRKGALRLVQGDANRISQLTTERPIVRIFGAIYFAPAQRHVLSCPDLTPFAKVLDAFLRQRDGFLRSRSQSQLARALGVSLATVHRAIGDLHAAGKLAVTYRDFGKHESATYTPITDDDTDRIVYLPRYLMGEVSWAELLVAGVIATKAGAAGWARISYADVSEALGMDEQAVGRAVRRLLAERILVRASDTDTAGRAGIFRFLFHPRMVDDRVGLRPDATLDQLLVPEPIPHPPAGVAGRRAPRRGSGAEPPVSRSCDSGPAPLLGALGDPSEDPSVDPSLCETAAMTGPPRKIEGPHRQDRRTPPSRMKGGTRTDEGREIDALNVGWNEAMVSVYGSEVPAVRWRANERRMAGDMIADLGKERASRVVRRAIETWTQRDRWSGHPSLGLVFVARQELALEQAGGGDVSVGKHTRRKADERKKMVEFNPELAERSAKFGW